jgi:uncharacterized membrane protein HdeD (DUF308 family)
MSTLTHSSPLERVAQKAGSLWWLPLVAGIAWIVIGFVILRFDGATVAVITVAFGIMVLFAAAGETLRATLSSGGWRVWHAVFAGLLVVGAVIIFARPGASFVSLALVTGLYFIIAGTLDIVSSLFNTAHPGWWLPLLSGIAEVILGCLASSSYESSVVVLVTSVSVVAIFRGVSEIGAAFTIRQLRTA